RVIALDVEGFDGPGSGCTLAAPCWIRTTTSYDANGNVYQTSRPFLLAGGTAQYATYNYGTIPDPYGRPITVTAPNGGVTTYTYTGLGNAGSQTSVKDALNHTTVTAKNAQGLVSSVTNALTKTTSYVYDAYGDLLTVTDPLGNQIANTYDIRGNKLTMSDPDMGLWNYSYDALGEALTQVDPNERANSTTTTMTYDGLGRLHVRTQPDQTDTWNYDTATNGVGLLASANGSSASYSRTHFYDSLSRPTQVNLSINGGTYTYNRSYNSDSRMATLTYPSGLVVKYVYTTLGYLYQVQDNATSAVLWTAKSRDAELHLTEAQTGSGGVDTIQNFDPATGLVQQIRASNDGIDDGSVANLSYGFDKIGNLKSRSDNYGGSEQFCYDKLNRLINYSLNSTTCKTGAGQLRSVAYDDIGDITLKSDLADTSGGTGAYTYANPTHPLPHAVQSINGTVNGVADPNYKYDADGNLTCEYTGPNCSHGAITKETDAYWSFNMTHTISNGATSLTLTYDSEHARITQVLTAASTTTTTNYLNDPISGAMAEKVATTGGNTWNDYLTVDGKLAGERVCNAPTPTCPATSASWQYFILDHLGSVAVVTDGTTAAVTARESFDAWGKQRLQTGYDDLTCSSGLTSPTTRGFTGQEDIAALCLVNLNARLYDPSIGRFMSADSIIPDPNDLQSYNRYTYVDNRPLSLTDPTGHGDTPFLPPDEDPAWNPDIRCMGNCGGGSGVGAATPMQQAALDAHFHGATGISVGQNSNGSLAESFTCSGGGGACMDYGNSLVSQNGGTITGEGARAEYAGFLHQMGRGVTYIQANENTYLAVAAPAGTFVTVAFNYADANAPGTGMVSENGSFSSGLIRVQTMSEQDPSGLNYWEPGARWNDAPDWEGTETWARSEVLQPMATYGERMAAYFRQSNVQNVYLYLLDQGMEHWALPTLGQPGSGPSYQFKNNLIFSDRNGDAQMDQMMFRMGTALMINYGETGDFGHGPGWRVYSPNTIQPAPPMGEEE
ncbi:MAG TPA: RHS repeat-associated core domain-containing protein, partial [Rhizomicrobium sp.]|nr:RHS repeat-associated core domain-containing protein [Rhizomicrobium sp.]